MLQNLARKYHRVVMEQIYRGAWEQPIHWGYYTGEAHPYHLIVSRSQDEEQAMLFWPEEAIIFVLHAQKEGVACHLEPSITITF